MLAALVVVTITPASLGVGFLIRGVVELVKVLR
jgi:hypothetical protein